VPGAAGRKFAVLGVLWPSKKFADKELIASGAAGAASTVELDDLRGKLRALRGTFDAADADQKLADLEKLLPKLEDSTSACKAFVEGVRGLMKPGAGDEADAAKLFFSMPAGDLFAKLQQPVSFTATAAPRCRGCGERDRLLQHRGAAARRPSATRAAPRDSGAFSAASARACATCSTLRPTTR